MYGLQPGYALFFLLLALLASGLGAIIHRKRRLAFASSTVILVLIWVLLSYCFITGYDGGSTLHIYQFSSLLGILFAISLILVNILSYAYEESFSAFSAIFAIAAAGIFLVVVSNSFITLLLGMEIVAIPTVFLIGLDGKSAEPTAKFLILSALAVAAFAFGLSLLLPYDLQLSYAPLLTNSAMPGPYMPLLGIILVISALSFEASIFPFNLWVPDVYQGARSNVTALLAGVNKKIAFVAIAYAAFIAFAPYLAQESIIFTVLAIFTMFFGNIMALGQKNVKRLFAYSSIAQAGYILVGFAAITQYGMEASIFQIIAHSFMIIGIFAIILWMERQGKHTISDYASLSGKNAFAALSLTIFMLSLAGVPPLIGFTGKFLLFTSAISSGMLGLALIGIFNSFISIYYYGRLILSMYSRGDNRRVRMIPQVAVVAAVALAVVIIIGIYPQPIISAASSASASLLQLG